MYASSAEMYSGTTGASLPLFAAASSHEAPRAFNPLRVMIFMLSKVALEPTITYQQKQDLEQGLVRLQFFGVSNPVPCFVASRSDPDFGLMLAAIDRNLAGPLMAAAKRVLKWTSPARRIKGLAREAAIMKCYRESMSFPVADAWRGFSEENKRLLGLMEQKRRAIRSKRQERLAILQTAASGAQSYYQLLDELQADVSRTLQ